MDAERATLINIAIGRLFRLGSRPTQLGDLVEYEFCREIIMSQFETPTDNRPNYVRDRLRGTWGDA